MTKTINLLEMRALLCPECGMQLIPGIDPLTGTMVTERNEFITYTHPSKRDCSHSEEVYKIAISGPGWPAEVIGRMDYSTVPAKLVKE